MQIQESRLSEKMSKFFTKKSIIMFFIAIILAFLISFALNPYLFSIEALGGISILGFLEMDAVSFQNILACIPHPYSVPLLFLLALIVQRIEKYSVIRLIGRDLILILVLFIPYFFVASKSDTNIGLAFFDQFGALLFVFLIYILPIVCVGRTIFTLLQKLITGKIIYNHYTPAIWATIFTILTLVQAIYSQF